MMMVLEVVGSVPKPGSRVRVDGLVYLVCTHDDPTALDDEVCVVEMELAPTDVGPSKSQIRDVRRVM